jgi:glutathione S-transferase
MLTIWGRLNSINVQKVIWAADEAGIAYERIDAGAAFGINTTPEYRAMNPNGLVPVMRDGGFVLWESNAISRYLASKYAPGVLYPADAEQRAICDQWMDWMATELNPAFGPAFMQLIRTPQDKRDPAIVEAGRIKTEDKLNVLEARLAQSPYLTGDTFTIADIIVGLGLNRWLKLPLERQSHPAIEQWFARLSPRAGAKQVMAVPLT